MIFGLHRKLGIVFYFRFSQSGEAGKSCYMEQAESEGNIMDRLRIQDTAFPGDIYFICLKYTWERTCHIFSHYNLIRHLHLIAIMTVIIRSGFIGE